LVPRQHGATCPYHLQHCRCLNWRPNMEGASTIIENTAAQQLAIQGGVV
jgi:hypothetical protein